MADKDVVLGPNPYQPLRAKDTSVAQDGSRLVLEVVQVDASGNAGSGPNASGSPVALASPPSATNAGSATALHFASDINHLYLINQTTTPAIAIGVAWRVGVTASAGSYQLPAGGVLALDVHIAQADGISLYTASAVNINGTAGNNLVVEGTS